MKKLTLIALLATLSTSAFALKIGYVNTQEIMEKSSAAKSARASLTSESKSLENTIKAKQNELKNLQEQLQKKGKNITEADKKNYNNKLEEFKKLIANSGTQLRNKEIAKMKEIDAKLNTAIQSVAKSGGYDYILEKGAVKFGGEDVTSKVLGAMK